MLDKGAPAPCLCLPVRIGPARVEGVSRRRLSLIGAPIACRPETTLGACRPCWHCVSCVAGAREWAGVAGTSWEEGRRVEDERDGGERMEGGREGVMVVGGRREGVVAVQRRCGGKGGVVAGGTCWEVDGTSKEGGWGAVRRVSTPSKRGLEGRRGKEKGRERGREGEDTDVDGGPPTRDGVYTNQKSPRLRPRAS